VVAVVRAEALAAQRTVALAVAAEEPQFDERLQTCQQPAVPELPAKVIKAAMQLQLHRVSLRLAGVAGQGRLPRTQAPGKSP
jgi:hypothetical protein